MLIVTPYNIDPSYVRILRFCAEAKDRQQRNIQQPHILGLHVRKVNYHPFPKSKQVTPHEVTIRYLFWPLRILR